MIFIYIGIAAIFLFFLGSAYASTGGCNPVATCGITSDESTWPSGDVVWNVARAIARAEGANVPGSNPDNLNNPGDISDGGATYGFEFHSGSAVTKFPDKQTGWQWLYDKLKNAFVYGNSHVYSQNMTWTQLAQKWASNWQPWVDIVTGSLNVSPDDRVGDYFGA